MGERFLALALAAGSLVASGPALGLEPETSPLHFVAVVEAGGGELLGRPGSWTGGCHPRQDPTGCAGQLRPVDGFTDVPGDLGTSVLETLGGGLGFGIGLTRWLTFQLLFDARYAAGAIGAGAPVSQNGSSYQLGPGAASELLLDLPADLRLRLGSFWDLYGGVAPAVMTGVSVPATATSTAGTRTGSLSGAAAGLLWRAGLDRFFDYRASAFGLLVEGAVGGGVGALLTFTLHAGDDFETIR
ncbi:MAG: hypothetical protein ACYCWW_17305 [Deltaproteobacteria bacterium]